MSIAIHSHCILYIHCVISTHSIQLYSHTAITYIYCPIYTHTAFSAVIHSHCIVYILRTVYTHTASSTLPPHTATHPNSIAYTHPHHITDNNTALCHTALYLYCIISNVLMCECTWCSFAECIRILSKYTHLLSVRQDLYTDLLSVIRESLYMHACVDSARLSPMAMIVISVFF